MLSRRFDPGSLPLVMLLASSLLGCSSSSSEPSPPGQVPLTLSFGVTEIFENEAAEEIRVPVLLDRVAPEPVEVEVQLGGSATRFSGGSGADYVVLGDSRVVIPAGELQAELILLPFEDSLVEISETIALELLSPDTDRDWSLGGQSSATVVLLDVPGVGGGSSIPLGSILLSAYDDLDPSTIRQLHSASDGAGITMALTPAGVEVAHPTLAPGGEHLAYQGSVGFDAGVFVLRKSGGPIFEASGLAVDGSAPLAWSPDGAVLAFAEAFFAAGHAGMAMLDPDGSDLVVVRVPGHRIPQEFSEPYRWRSDSQRIAFLSKPIGLGPVRLFGVNRDGTELLELSSGLAPGLGVEENFQWSPDGSRLAFQAGSDLYAVNGDGSGLELVGSDLVDVQPFSNPYNFLWSPNSEQIAFVGLDARLGFLRLFASQVPGGPPQLLSFGSTADIQPRWSWNSDGAQVAYIAKHGEDRQVLRVAQADGTGFAVVSGDHDALDLRWSPAGEYVAYRAEDGEFAALWSGRADGLGRQRISLGGALPENLLSYSSYGWSPLGDRVSYSSGQQPLGNGRSLASDLPQGGDRVVHLGPLPLAETILEHRWSADGQRLSARIGVSVGASFLSAVRLAPLDGQAPVIEPTSNLHAGSGVVVEYFLR